MKYQDGSKIFFYTHWGGSYLKETLKDALERSRDRWNDESYLARIVFSEMIKDSVGDTTGYGIAPYAPDNEHEHVIVNVAAKTITEGENHYTFDDFCKEDWKAVREKSVSSW